MVHSCKVDGKADGLSSGPPTFSAVLQRRPPPGPRLAWEQPHSPPLIGGLIMPISWGGGASTLAGGD